MKRENAVARNAKQGLQDIEDEADEGLALEEMLQGIVPDSLQLMRYLLAGHDAYERGNDVAAASLVEGLID